MHMHMYMYKRDSQAWQADGARRKCRMTHDSRVMKRIQRPRAQACLNGHCVAGVVRGECVVGGV